MFLAAYNNGVRFQLLYALSGDKVLFKHNRRYYNVLQGGMDVAPSFPKACDDYLEHPGPLLDLFSPGKGIGEFKLKISQKNSWITTTSFVSRKYMERTSFFKLSRCLLRDFDSLVHFFLIMKMREDRQSAFTADLLLEEAIVTHVVTCQGRDHLVNIRSRRHSLVIVNVHFEPELTLRQLHGRLSIIHPHWPAYPCGVGVILSDFKHRKKDDLMFGTNPFTDGDPGKTAVFHSFFAYVLEIAQSYTRRDSSAVGNIRALSRIDRIF